MNLIIYSLKLNYMKQEYKFRIIIIINIIIMIIIIYYHEMIIRMTIIF